MDGIVEFLTARLDEDQRIAEACARDVGVSWYDSVGESVYSNDFPNLPVAVGPWGTGMAEETITFISRHDPGRVLAEVGAKRAILAVHRYPDQRRDPEHWVRMAPQGCVGCGWEGPCEDLRVEDMSNCPVVHALVIPFADHPDFCPRWADTPFGLR